MLRNVLALLFGLALAATAGEFLLRIFGAGGSGITRHTELRVRGQPWPYEPGSRLIYRFPDNPRGYFDGDSIIGHINSLGFRGEETTVERAGPRVLFIGDSFTLGMGVRDEHTLPARTAATLGVEGLNMGVSGSTIVEQVDRLEHYGLRFRPDVTVLVLFLNDAGAEGTIQFLGRGRIFAGVQRVSHLARATLGTMERVVLTRRMVRAYHESFADTSAGWNEIRAQLVRARKLTEAAGSHLVVALYPVLFRLDDYPFTAIHEKLEQFCADVGITHVDLLPAFRGRRDRELWAHAADQHPNENAHALAAVHLAERLRPSFESLR